MTSSETLWLVTFGDLVRRVYLAVNFGNGSGPSGNRRVHGPVPKVKAKDDPVFERLLEKDQKINTLLPTMAWSLHFALGKIYNDVKEYDKAFSYYPERTDASFSPRSASTACAARAYPPRRLSLS